MKVATFLAVAGGIGVLFGLEFLLVPAFALGQYGVPTEPHNLMQARYFGATLLAFSLILLLARHTRDDAALRAILQGSVVGNALGAGISVWAVTTGLQNAMAWVSVTTYLVICLASVYYLSSPAKRKLEAA